MLSTFVALSLIQIFFNVEESIDIGIAETFLDDILHRFEIVADIGIDAIGIYIGVLFLEIIRFYLRH